MKREKEWKKKKQFSFATYYNWDLPFLPLLRSYLWAIYRRIFIGRIHKSNSKTLRREIYSKSVLLLLLLLPLLFCFASYKWSWIERKIMNKSEDDYLSLLYFRWMLLSFFCVYFAYCSRSINSRESITIPSQKVQCEQATRAKKNC